MCRFPNQKIGEHPFSRSYGVILPSSFDMVLSSALVYSTCSPVSVWGTTRDAERDIRKLKRTLESASKGVSRCAEPEPGMFARWAECSPTSESSPLDNKKCPPLRERRVRGRGGSPRPDHPIRSNRQAWFCSQSNFVTFVFRGKPAISDLGWPFTPSHKSSPYFATYVGSVLQGLLELSSTCSWLDRSVSGQIGRTRRFHLWKAPTPNGLSRCSHFLADPSCKRYAVRVSALD
ncbi:hypothetical protein L1887_59666 [Cichorium endivia]|nr:hypothetical protein L1887_59666 [Cichorium endivia]